MVDSDEPSRKEMLFLQIVSMFQVAAMHQLGKLIDPSDGEAKRDLEQAKTSIDILDVLKEKTRGNLTRTEEDFLDKVLFELHMNYVDELNASAKRKDEETGAEGRQPKEDETAGTEARQPKKDETAGTEASQPKKDETAGTEASQPKKDETAGTEASRPKKDQAGRKEGAKPSGAAKRARKKK